MTLYRDPLAGLKSQVGTKRGLVELRQRELSPLLRAMLPAALRVRLDELRPRAFGAAVAGSGTTETMEVLSDADAALDALLWTYDEAAALLPKLRDCPLDVPDPPKPNLPPPWLIEESRQIALRRRFEERVRDISADAYVIRWGDITYLARLRLAGAPLVAMCRGNFDVQAITTSFTGTLRTSVPPSTPPVVVEAKGSTDGIAKALGLKRDDATGDAAFDDAFMVDARGSAVVLLTADVTAAMRTLAPWSPSLRVRRGVVEVSWAAAFRDVGYELLHDAAFAVALGVRAAIERA